MHEKIADFFRSRKGQDVLLVSTMVLLAMTSFGLGRLSERSTPLDPVTLYLPGGDPAAAALVSASPGQVGQSVATASAGSAYVASRNSDVYHAPECSGAQRIKEENKIWFTTQEEARAAGLRPAANCPVLE